MLLTKFTQFQHAEYHHKALHSLFRPKLQKKNTKAVKQTQSGEKDVSFPQNSGNKQHKCQEIGFMWPIYLQHVIDNSPSNYANQARALSTLSLMWPIYLQHVIDNSPSTYANQSKALSTLSLLE